MKKITFLILAVPLVFAACSATNNAPSNSNNAATTSATEKPTEKPMEVPKSTEAQTAENVSRLEAIEKRLAAVEGQLARIAATTSGASPPQPGQLSGTSSDNGTRFIGNWKGVRSGDYMSISKDGNKYIIREPSAGVFPCELSNGSLKSGTFIGNVDFIELSGHITWRGIEWQKLPQTSR